MPKRKSGQGAGPAKMQRLKSSNDLIAEGLNHVQKITDWLRETVHPAGGPDQWLERTYKTEAQKLDFGHWLDESFPPYPELEYATSLTEVGPKILRPYQLGWRADMGLAHMCEPDDLECLVQLILSEGFRTCPELPGVEALAVVKPDRKCFEKPYKALPPLHPESNLIGPFSVGYIKGWRRSLAAMISAEGIKSLGISFDELTPAYKESMRAVYGTVGSFQSVKDQIHCSRGITMGSTQTRKVPNAFQFCRQLEVLKRAGSEAESFDEWESAAAIAKAYKIGKFESAAVSNLMHKIGGPVTTALKDAVQKRGMRAFILHETVGKDVFNTAFTSGTGAYEAWAIPLTNTMSGEIALLLIRRMCSDYDRLPLGARRPWNFKDTVQLHILCGGFLHFKGLLQRKLSAQEFDETVPKLDDQFLMGFLDADIDHALQSCVPPGELGSVAFLRTISQEVDARHQRELEARNQELAEKVASATLEQLRAKILADFDVLKAVAPSPARDAHEAAWDLKYLKERQMKGQTYVKTWMQKNFSIVLLTNSQLSSILGLFAKFTSELGVDGGTVYVLVALDATIYPADAGYLDGALQIVSTVCHFGPHAIAHLQLPVPQSNTNTNALLRHTRTIEDSLHSRGIDITHKLSLHFTKPADSTGNDKRKLMQSCMACFSDGDKLLWQPPSVVGPLPLIRINEMRGYDSETRPGPTARAEQKGLAVHDKIIKAYLDGLTLGPKDQVVLFDLIGNREQEFGRAALERALGNQQPTVKYFGVLRPNQKDVLQQFEKAVYDSWDASPDAPPQQRTRSQAERPALSILAWENGCPQFPDHLLRKFPDGTVQDSEIKKLQQELTEMWPAPAPVPGQSRSAGPARVAAGPDLSGLAVLDLAREIDLPHIAVVGFSVERLGFSQGKNNKPSILISKDFDIYLGNLTAEALSVKAGELFGFYTGSYESKIIQGLGEREANSLPFRLESDLTLVADTDKIPLMLCQFVCKLARDRGFGEVDLEDHSFTAKMRPAEGDGSEAVPMPFRYQVGPTEVMKTSCFRPNPIGPNFDPEKHKPSTLGAVYMGQMNRVPRQDINKKVALVWEVAVVTGSATPKITPVKPKVYLTCGLLLPAQTWTKLT